MKDELTKKFYEIFGLDGDCKIFFAPGRVNLIGEHTDYNGGHVFPCALTIGTYAAARIRQDRTFRFYSVNFEQAGIIETSIDQLDNNPEDDWANYPKGVIWTLRKKGYPIENGLDILYYGTIPNGSGLSSSASIEVLTGFLIRSLFKMDISMKNLALYSQYAENNFNGVNCGIMDQFAIAMGRKNHALFLNTSDLSYEYVPVHLEGAKIVIMNTNKKRGLGDSKYNERRSECEAALADLKKIFPIENLGELSEDQFETLKHAIRNPIHAKRAKHAVYENQRTIKALNALKNNNLTQFGDLMNASHKSLQYDYEVSGRELDAIVEAAWKQDGVIGARMTGAGFGGCAISIVKETAIETFIEQVGYDYHNKTGYKADFYIVEIGSGPIVLE